MTEQQAKQIREMREQRAFRLWFGTDKKHTGTGHAWESVSVLR